MDLIVSHSSEVARSILLQLRLVQIADHLPHSSFAAPSSSLTSFCRGSESKAGHSLGVRARTFRQMHMSVQVVLPAGIDANIVFIADDARVASVDSTSGCSTS